MTRVRSCAALALALLLFAGCNTRKCKHGTVLVTLVVPAGTDQIAIAVSVGDVPPTTQTMQFPSGTTHGTIELDFSSYPAGQTIGIEVTALQAGANLGSATSAPQPLAAGCDSLGLTIGGDGSMDDLAAELGGICTRSADCPRGQACDTTTGTCVTSCSASQPCNGGCCDSASCVVGTDLAHCGSDGNLCAACGSGQACQAGACGVTCEANAPCNGGCCDSAQHRCVAGSAADQCALGNVLCDDCAKSATGQACLTTGSSTVCGCSSATDCPANLACDAVTHSCTTACGTPQPCHGGCCSAASAGTCQPGTLAGACGANGGVCAACPADQNGHLCVTVAAGGHCGCNAVGDCPLSSSSCNTTTQVCVNACSGTIACQSGCCTSANVCDLGTTSASCGAIGSTCRSCMADVNGHTCLPSGKCGCTQRSDCPTGQACNTTTSTCTTICGTNQACNGGCCSASAGGTCQSGTVAAGCGASGVCSNCLMNGNGNQCLSGVCGCNTSADCPANTACDTTTHACTSGCSMTQACNGGCCSASSGGTCQAGTASTSCGNSGVCGSCVANNNGHQCIGFTCGCNGPGDCPLNMACNLSMHQCTTACSPSQTCNGGCCSGGSCSTGATTSACGSSGGTCAACPSGSPPCTPSYSCNGTSCIPNYAGSATGCDDGNSCTGSDHCNGSGGCVGNVLPNGTSCPNVCGNCCTCAGASSCQGGVCTNIACCNTPACCSA